MSPAAQFLDMVWGDKQPELWLLLWQKSDKRSFWFDGLEAAAEFASGKVDL